MNTPLSFRNLGITFFIGLTISYVSCILSGVLFDWTMYQVWTPLLPGFSWPVTAGGFFVGLLWLVGYSLYGALLLVVPYNYLARRQSVAQ